jgi:hypothetical protein
MDQRPIIVLLFDSVRDTSAAGGLVVEPTIKVIPISAKSRRR